ncbi:MAG: ATP-dependent metallopeptidase FtsH/Yme1/Tma family protein [bacterium]|nr:ATP-dependent metallopeptidase FtsH/Yme1/Tma family protein [bacterium]
MDTYGTDKKKKRKGIKFKKGGGKRPQNEDYKDDFQWRRGGRTAIVWIVFILSILFLYQLKVSMDQEAEPLLENSEYKMLLESESIESATIIDREFHGTLKERQEIFREGVPIVVLKFKSILPPFYKEMEDDWKQYGVNYSFKQKDIEWSTILVSTLPWVLIIMVWIFLFRRMQQGGSKGIFSFGKSRAKLLVENKPKITFDNVAGADEAKTELQEIIEFLKQPERYSRLGGKIPKGALLIGPPGTGKTLLARAVAGEAGVPFFSISGADFVELFVGVGASRVRDLFEQGKKNAPCIVFIDEIDAVGRSRGAGLGGGNDEREQTLNQLLVEMDGFEHNEGVILLAATNRPDVLDKALLRPGRFDRQIVVDRPDVRGREGILRVHTKNIPLDAEVNLKTIAKGTPGLAGADLANIVNEAALLAARLGKKKVENDDFEAAKDKVMMGIERKSLLISEKEKKSTAYHESGHVIVGIYMPEADPIHKVTIIPRGRALGVTTSLPIDDKHTYSKEYCTAQLAKLMGGRVAEKLIFNTLTTGAGNDIEQATNLAKKMVCEWGMSEKMGPLTFGKKDDEIFLGREISTNRGFSNDTAQLIDLEVKKLIIESEKKAEEILKDNLEVLHVMADELLKREILDSEEINKLIKGEKLPEIKREDVESEEEKVQADTEEPQVDGEGKDVEEPDVKKAKTKKTAKKKKDPEAEPEVPVNNALSTGKNTPKDKS